MEERAYYNRSYLTITNHFKHTDANVSYNKRGIIVLKVNGKEHPLLPTPVLNNLANIFFHMFI